MQRFARGARYGRFMAKTRSNVKDTLKVSLELPTALLTRIDSLISSRTSPFMSREDFIEQAIVQHFASSCGDSRAESDEVTADTEIDTKFKPNRSPSAAITPTSDALRELTRLGNVPPLEPLVVGLATITDSALPGLHARDYPSLWAAHELASICKEGPVRWDVARKELVKRAWEFGEQIGNARANDGSHLNALFPTNRLKPQSAENAFRDFVIGKVSDQNGHITATGPLFTWKICQVALREGRPSVGFTVEGIRLLDALFGLQLEVPHQNEETRVFFAYLATHATGDWRALMEVLRLCHAMPTRAEVLAAFRRAQPGWSDAQTSANVSGYVSRCREWGLIAPKQLKGRYQLTQLGNELLDTAMRAVVRVST